jgi:hypothetical protein
LSNRSRAEQREVQRQLVKSAVASLPLNTREGFLADLSRRLGAQPTDAAAAAAVNAAVDRTMIEPVFLCDSLEDLK